MEICIIGMGYIGLPTAVTLASSGIGVYGYDINRELIAGILEGKTDIVEEGLEEKLKEALKNGLLTAGTELRGDSDIYLLVVSTSLNKESNKLDLRALKAATRDLGRVLKKGDLVIVESTVIPGTTEGVVKPILEEESGLTCCEDFYLAFCPERVLPGSLMKELINNDRIIGGMDRRSSEMARNFYAQYVKGKLHITDARTAEMAKLMENTYRAVNIALANELAFIAEENGINIYEAIRMANNHPRVNVHLPGPGVGGYCLTKDPWFLIQDFDGSRIIKDALDINSSMPDHVAEMVEKELSKVGKGIQGSKVCVLGMAYKGNVSDARESPGYEIYLRLQDKGVKADIHDHLVREYMGKIPVKEIYEAVKGADALVVATEHDLYRELDWERIKSLMNDSPIVIDTKNIVPDSIPGFNVKKLGVGL